MTCVDLVPITRKLFLILSPCPFCRTQVPCPGPRLCRRFCCRGSVYHAASEQKETVGIYLSQVGEDNLEHDPLNLHPGPTNALRPAERRPTHQAPQFALLLGIPALSCPDPL